ncbi:MAG: beta-propeller domain-containing protein [Microthrixaceae bacterium]
MAACTLIAAACPDSGKPPIAAGPGEIATGLHTDLSCDELLEASQEDTERVVELNSSVVRLDSARGGFTDAGEESDAMAPAEAAPTTAADDSTGGAGGEVIAGTNIQEQGVDEGDTIKTDGERIVALSGTTLRVVELDGSPEVDGTLLLPSNVEGDVGELFLRGAEALVLIPTWGSGSDPGPPPPSRPGVFTPTAETTVVPFDQGLRILRVDISDPTTPEMIDQSVVEGTLVASRMVDGTVRVVVRTPSFIAEDMWSLQDTNDVAEVFDGIEATDLLPRVSVDGEVSAMGGCEDVAVMPAPAASVNSDIASRSLDHAGTPETVTVLSIGEDLADMSPVSVSGLADVVYASTDSLYITNTGWTESGPNTFVHHFDTSTADPATYTGSGIVPGAPLNQYSLSESGDQLRIVTTTEDPTAFEDGFVEEGLIDEQVIDSDGTDGIPIDDLPTAAEDGTAPDDTAPVDTLQTTVAEPDVVEPDVVTPERWVPATEGRLTVLAPSEDGALDEIGSIEDLGVGEEVQSVRFQGDMAYVVTFRRTDPLYAIDLSDPTTPRALGELKITGFSEYMHPVGEGLLLGIGREATADGRDTGFKASLFDVSDPTNPTETDRWVVPNGWSEVGDDPHAFTWDPVAGRAIFPLEQYGDVSIDDCPPGALCEQIAPIGPSNTAVVLAAGPDGLEEVARLTHNSGSGDGYMEQIRRSVVVDRDLWTMSHTGLGLTNADQPGAMQFVPF